MNPDQLAELEDERRFLLRSLRDLDAELAAGDVDRVDYETLRDGYTKRAADVLRGIEDGKAALPVEAPAALGAGRGRRRRRAASSPPPSASSPPARRVSGRPVTRSRVVSRVARTPPSCCRGPVACSAATPASPRTPTPSCSTASRTTPRRLTYSAWLLYFVSAGASPDLRDVAVATAKEQLARAVAVDPAYPDPHCFLAVIAADADADMATARTEADACLANDPPAQVRVLVEGMFDRPPTRRLPCRLPADAAARRRATAAFRGGLGLAPGWSGRRRVARRC